LSDGVRAFLFGDADQKKRLVFDPSGSHPGFSSSVQTIQTIQTIQTRRHSMTSHLLRNTVLLASAFLYGAAAHGDTIYNESVSGDLSNSGLTPTALTFSLGLNDVFGTTGKSATTGIIDRDYFTFTVAPGLELTAITVLPGTQTLGTLGESFIGVQAGSEVTVSPLAANATGLLGWYHYGEDTIGVNILPLMGTSGLGSTGFTGPLPSGTYSFWVQEASVGSVQYGLEFTEAPEPSTWTMMLTGMTLLVGTARRARSGP
jgi:hypothetical protein